MPTTIVFDTNYIRGFPGATSLLEGAIPQPLKTQIGKAFERRDLVALIETIRVETNAWIYEEQRKLLEKLESAAQLLNGAGYAITPNTVSRQEEIDIAELLRKFNKNIPTLHATLEDYREAERRTSFKLPPLPKNKDGEEMRDRIVWCQILRYAKESKNSVLIVSNDALFKNGAASKEGRAAGITCVEGIEGLDQHLGTPSPHIEAIIGKLLRFSELLGEAGIVLNRESIISIDGVRAINGANGTTTYKFDLYSKNLKNGLIPSSITMTYFGENPIVVSVEGGEQVWYPFDSNDFREVGWKMAQAARENELSIMELRRLMEE